MNLLYLMKEAIVLTDHNTEMKSKIPKTTEKRWRETGMVVGCEVGVQKFFQGKMS